MNKILHILKYWKARFTLRNDRFPWVFLFGVDPNLEETSNFVPDDNKRGVSKQIQIKNITDVLQFLVKFWSVKIYDKVSTNTTFSKDEQENYKCVHRTQMPPLFHKFFEQTDG